MGGGLLAVEEIVEAQLGKAQTARMFPSIVIKMERVAWASGEI